MSETTVSVARFAVTADGRGLVKDAGVVLLRKTADVVGLTARIAEVFGPGRVERDLVRVAGRRWTVKENFRATKAHAGLDEHQVRRWDSWHRWTTLAMLAHAFLTILAVVMNDTEPTTTP